MSLIKMDLASVATKSNTFSWKSVDLVTTSFSGNCLFIPPERTSVAISHVCARFFSDSRKLNEGRGTKVKVFVYIEFIY